MTAFISSKIYRPIFIITTSLLIACSGKSGKTAENTYKSKDGITASYSNDWKPETSYSPDVFLLLLSVDKSGKTDMHQNIKCWTEELKDPNIDFKTMVTKNKEFAAANNMKLLEDGVTKIDGKDAFRVVYDSDTDPNEKVLQFIQIFDKKLHILTYTAKKEKFDEYKTSAEAVINSIHY